MSGPVANTSGASGAIGPSTFRLEEVAVKYPEMPERLFDGQARLVRTELVRESRAAAAARRRVAAWKRWQKRGKALPL